MMPNCGIHHFGARWMCGKQALALCFIDMPQRETVNCKLAAADADADAKVALAVCLINDGLTFPRELA